MPSKNANKISPATCQIFLRFCKAFTDAYYSLLQVISFLKRILYLFGSINTTGSILSNMVTVHFLSLQ